MNISWWMRQITMAEVSLHLYFFQNVGEAEYVVSVYIYMRLLGYPASKISILTTYNGQKLLIRDVINRRCAPYDFIGPPSKVTTVDKFQGQQNDFILLSLVRTRIVGHLRDVRRLIVAMSRARLGPYVFCRCSLFEQCYELQPTFQCLLQRPDHLALNLNEITSNTECHVEETGPIHLVSSVDEMIGIYQQLYEVKFHQYMPYSGRVDEILPMDTDGHHPMNTDMALTSDGAPADNGQHGSNMEEDTKGDVVANGQNTESSFEKPFKLR